MRYEHDTAGRTTLRQVNRLSKKPASWDYTWDAEDRPVLRRALVRRCSSRSASMIGEAGPAKAVVQKADRLAERR
ncbi:hypothetical protein [Streptomyces sp. NPDC101150]|uniref:hypothetical protein n=1 Tax=Streptomyces sp. NPDC101150 TaxID=3366114 RepID=UPI0037F6C0E8